MGFARWETGLLMRSRKRLRTPIALLAAGLLASAAVAMAPALPAAADDQSTLTVASAGTTSIESAATAPGSGDVASPEFPEITDENGETLDASDFVNRTPATGGAQGRSVNAGKKAKSNPELVLSFAGLNHRDQRLANNGNQFSLEPPDQALCVGHGFVLESTNDVMRVFNTSGSALTGVVDLNTFYGYAPAINRSAGNARGPFLTDPICHFDSATQRFIHVVLTLDSTPGGAFTGRNHLDVAVSNTADPRGTWTIYRIPTHNDGTEGTPDHGCSPAPGTPPASRTHPRACLADFPHIGVDRNGVYITTNEFNLFAAGFKHADIYAISKAQLVSTPLTLNVTVIDTEAAVGGEDGFTVWPAITPGDQFSDDAGGTEYFVSSRAVFADDDRSTSLVVWALKNTRSLNSTPALNLVNTLVTVDEYGVPPKSDQKAGSIPLADCINDTTLPITATLNGCWRLLFGAEPAHNAVLGKLDSSDSRVLTVTYANGKLWAALGTAVTVGGEDRAGIGWYILKPSAAGTGVSATLARQGVLALEHNNLIYPTIAVTPSGRGVMAFTLVGQDHFPSAGYAPIDAIVGVGDVRVAADGLGPQDGFTEYRAFTSRPRWGDYGAAAVDGRTVWVASEYIRQTCTFTQYVASPFGQCGGTRTSLGNWGTRISKLVP